jgi:hypothetical protein
MQADDMIADAAWAAGFIDGEGTISVRRIWTKKLNRYVYQLYLRAAQVEREPLEKIQRIFGGKIWSHQPRGVNDAPFFDWSLTSEKAGLAIRVMLPYLTIKRERGLVGLEFQSIMVKGRPHKSRDWAAEFAQQEGFWERMRVLNLRYAQRRAAAETEPRGPEAILPEVSDSPVCIDRKDAEGGRNDYPLKLAVGSGLSK